MNTKLKLLTTCLIAAALAVPIAAYTADYSDSDRSHPKAFVKDSVITTKVKAKLAKEKFSSAARIKVDTDNSGVVTLSGKARSQEEVDKAVSIANGVKGVTAVENNIQIAAHR